jgi:hypothetical protein
VRVPESIFDDGAKLIVCSLSIPFNCLRGIRFNFLIRACPRSSKLSGRSNPRPAFEVPQASPKKRTQAGHFSIAF